MSLVAFHGLHFFIMYVHIGIPSAYDRTIATLQGVEAVNLLQSNPANRTQVIGLQGASMTRVDMMTAVKMTVSVPLLLEVVFSCGIDEGSRKSFQSFRDGGFVHFFLKTGREVPRSHVPSWSGIPSLHACVSYIVAHDGSLGA